MKFECCSIGRTCDEAATHQNIWWYNDDKLTEEETLCEVHRAVEISRDAAITADNDGYERRTGVRRELRSIYLPLVIPTVGSEQTIYVEVMCHAFTLLSA